MNMNDVCDYIILKLTEGGQKVNLLKLHKLVYYTQAWSLAIHKRPLFTGKFQAWVHGPVSRDLYDRFASVTPVGAPLYATVDASDLREDFDPAQIGEDDRALIDAVLEVYGGFSGAQLEEMTHEEDPWREARKGYRPSQRCEVEIDETLMATYYAARLGKA